MQPNFEYKQYYSIGLKRPYIFKKRIKFLFRIPTTESHVPLHILIKTTNED
uniref:Ovule protein n=1 Tax=Schistosoma curassoni TaxID=6186 RepID=A0A183JDD1_9TREM